MVCRASGQGHGDIKEYVVVYIIPYHNRTDIDFRAAKEDVANVAPEEISKAIHGTEDGKRDAGLEFHITLPVSDKTIIEFIKVRTAFMQVLGMRSIL